MCRIALRARWLFAALTMLLITQAMAGNGHERLSLDRGWLFHLGDVPLTAANSHADSYNQVKAGNAGGAAAAEFDDSGWRKLDLPHDWAVEGPFDPKENIAQGYRPRGIAWYRRYLRVDEADRGRHIELQFDGIATHAQIWVNGHLLHRSWSGYTASQLDITPFLHYGDALNTVAVRVDADAIEGWWYEGAGIYRHSWLSKRDALHLQNDGLHITPQPLPGDRWRLPMAIQLNNSGRRTAGGTLDMTLYDPQGRPVARRSQRVSLAALQSGTVQLPIELHAPQRWTLEQPRLYRVEVVLREGQSVLDQASLSTGFRTLKFDAAQGFFLNGRSTKLQGVCIHQDHAGVGVAVPDAIWAYRLRRLKELGANAIRFSHNAPAPEVLDLADRMGFLVMDENRNFNPAPEGMGQLQWMVQRDRHHPSIILWSIFNEEPVQGSEVGFEMARRMAAAVKTLDTTRPVTAAMNGGFFSDLNVSHAVDVVGFNYQVPDYDRLHAARPEMPLTSSEDTSAFMTRGEFTTRPEQNLIASYDDDFAAWGNSHRDAWAAIASRAWLAGGFVWTGFDYRGEPTPNKWPSTGSVFGIMDLNGFPKAAYYMHQVQWIQDRPLLHIEPHWTWAGREGEPIRVMVMGNMERVKLRLNGRDLGEQAVDRARMNFFSVPYEPGRLEAIGYKGTQEVARSVVETTGAAVALQLLPDRDALRGNGQDALPITVRALDAQGRPVPLADAQLRIAVSGAGRSIGHGNGDPNSHEDEKGPSRRLFNGLAQLIVQVLPDATQGEVLVQVSAEGLAPASLRLPVSTEAQHQRVAWVPLESAPVTLLRYWRVSPPSALRPDPNQTLADNDMNTWGWDFPASCSATPAGNAWRIYRTQFMPRQNLNDGRARLRFASVAGRAEFWLDGQLLARKDDPGTAPFELTLPRGQGQRQLNVLIECAAAAQAGLTGLVRLE